MKFRIKKINPFTILLVVVSFSFVFRLSNLAMTPEGAKPQGAILSAQAIESSKEEPPPLPDGAAHEHAEHAQDGKEPATAAESGPPAGEATAQGVTEQEKTTQAQEARGLPDLPARAFSDAEIEVLQSLSKRRDELDRRERELGQRQALLDAAGQEIDQKVAELGSLRKELETLLGQQQTMQEERIKSLVKIYEGMKPKEAARIFDTLEMDVLLTVIGRMSERKTAPIFASMDPEKARTLTIKLAEQRKLPELPAMGSPAP